MPPRSRYAPNYWFDTVCGSMHRLGAYPFFAAVGHQPPKQSVTRHQARLGGSFGNLLHPRWSLARHGGLGFRPPKQFLMNRDAWKPAESAIHGSNPARWRLSAPLAAGRQSTVILLTYGTAMRPAHFITAQPPREAAKP